MIDVNTAWSANEGLLQSYRSTFVASQSFLVTVGAILVTDKATSWLLALIAGLALFMIWCIWHRVVVSRFLRVDYYKYQATKGPLGTELAG